MKSGLKKNVVVYFLGMIAFLIALNGIISYLDVRWDLTEDKRFTLSPSTENILASIDDRMILEVYLTGDFPAVFKKLEQGTRDLLTRYSRENPNLIIRYENPSVGSPEEVNSQRQEFQQDGLTPVRLNITGESVEKLIYPYASLKYGSKKVYINLLEADRAGVPNDRVINESLSLLEYKFTSGLLRLFQSRKKNVVFTSGHGELNPLETADLERSLRAYYNTSRVELDSMVHIPEVVDIVVLAKPQGPFSDRDKFILDQYIMNGGKVVFLLDKMRVNEDSLRTVGKFVATDRNLNLDDLLFNYGVRIQTNLVLSLEDNTRIPLQVGQMGGESQFNLFPWYYYLAAIPSSESTITKGLDRIRLTYASSIDTLESGKGVRKTPLIVSGRYSRYQFNPVEIDLNIVQYQPDVSAFNHSNLPLAVMLEGVFGSLYKNRVTPQMKAGLEQLEQSFKQNSEETKIMVVSDGDIARNEINPQTREPRALGYDRYEQFTFANRTFLINAIEYMTGMESVLSLRNREIQLRLLDQQKIRQSGIYYQIFNIGGPIVLFLMVTLLWIYFRKWKYGR
ncbi:gliding motility-associated ABC transporter substrate-binding protein GldG [Membranihabitans maritimus]|uniref:gliding motility-associated ABC transporter substrate-binding protein GldG n=1 Tax=Membranihabitans maritimus TaxID=2904244 RepID=UPI001F361883|nr:gliding motility-associated ABC transporter substrate-binding protein GldG [Membranihabitans maritimus]